MNELLTSSARRSSSSRIIRIPMDNNDQFSLKLLNKKLLETHEIKIATRKKLLEVYDALGDPNIRSSLDHSYYDALIEQTSNLNLTLIPEDYPKIFRRLICFPNVASEYVQVLNGRIQELHTHFTTKQISSLLRSYVFIKSRPVKTVHYLVETFCNKFDTAKTSHIRDMISSLATLRIPNQGIVEKLHNIVVPILPKRFKQMDPSDIAIFVNSFVRQGVNQNEIIHFIEMNSDKIVSDASPKSIALIINAFAKNNKSSNNLLLKISKKLSGIMDKIINVEQNDLCHEKKINVIDVAMSFNAFVKLEFFDEKLLNKYIPWLIKELNLDTSILSLVLISHAYSQCDVKSKELFSRIACLSIPKLSKFNCQQLGVIALSFTRVGYVPRLFFCRIADEIIYRGTIGLNHKRYLFDFQSLEQLMQAFSRIGFKDQRIYATLTTLLKQRFKETNGEELNGTIVASLITSISYNKVDQFVPFIINAIEKIKSSSAYSTVAIAKILSAFNKLKIKNRPLVELFLQETRDRVNQFSPSSLISSVNSLSQLKCYDSLLIKETIKRVTLHLAQLSTYDISNVISALANFGYRNVSFIKKISVCINYRIDEFSKQQLNNIFNKLTILRTSDLNLLLLLFDKISINQHELNGIDIGKVCMSYIYLLMHFDCLNKEIIEGKCPNISPYVVPETYDVFLDRLIGNLSSKLDVSTIFIMKTIYLYLTHLKPEKYYKLSSKSKELLKKCDIITFNLAEYILTSSPAHRELSHFLNLAGVLHKNEVQCGPYLIDIVPEVNPGIKVAIEYDGPSHFYAETVMRNIKSITKHEILESMGWEVIHVPYQEWIQLGCQLPKYQQLLVSDKQKIVYCNKLKMEMLHLAQRREKSNSTNFHQKRMYSTNRISTRKRLKSINSNVMKQYLDDLVVNELEENTPSESTTDEITDEIYSIIINSDGNIIDIDIPDADKE
ncbi:hypothetical protein BEWA_018580 [Theileria equi strain WA]|uniref:RAP domain-containing protein n=1 Tax=Theileria equi strain WA TaxID=1537102 RepID=L0AUV1_THEEQ|nr:hypothetical protein BEWA_018580 [Theileria equi strain WA]AFZ79013.1 hypothetical protein BEWA_018580 [Theileria equi strain WA]|eukprot:XP_004828679.1 hypothetical protein BEWA_018580 [Theileria equi strain WA]